MKMTTKCVHSRAWHTARTQALLRGMCPATAKEGFGVFWRGAISAWDPGGVAEGDPDSGQAHASVKAKQAVRAFLAECS